MCRVAPEHIWPHLVAEHPVEKSWEQVKEPKFSHTEYGSFGKVSGSYNAGLVEFPGMCPICHKNDRRPKWNFGDNWEKTQDPSPRWLGFKTKTIEEEVDELADLMGAASLNRHAGWQEPEPLERRAWYWGWLSVVMGMLVTFLMLAMMWRWDMERGIQMYQDSVRAQGICMSKCSTIVSVRGQVVCKARCGVPLG